MQIRHSLSEVLYDCSPDRPPLICQMLHDLQGNTACQTCHLCPQQCKEQAGRAEVLHWANRHRKGSAALVLACAPQL